MTLEQIIAGHGEFHELVGYRFKKSAEHVKCVDGESLSVQAGRLLYSTPRNDDGPYTEVEVGYPSVSPPDTWAEFLEGNWETDDHTDSVYAWVPIALVREFVAAHGGEVGADGE